METGGFIYGWNTLQEIAYQNAKKKGFWDNKLKKLALRIESVYGREWLERMPDIHALVKEVDKLPDKDMPTQIALMHSELSEALEGIRHGNPPDDKIPDFSSLEAELADEVIRIMDVSGGMNLRVAEAVVAKLMMNEKREYMHGGKAF